LTVPIFFPVATSLGFNPIWLGIIITRVTEIGVITPPVGMNVYVIKGVARDVPLTTIFKGIMPFLLADVISILLLLFVPQITLFLPSLISK
jgi:TRAP-type C4-dicarboxylate transport system permease large subunit